MEHVYRVGDLTLSGREARPAGAPAAIVLALHGGGYSAGYWDHPAHSLLRRAASRGFLAVAVDRPGYGAAFSRPMPLAEQVDVVLELAATLRETAGPVPLLVAGHSMGGILGLLAAARPDAAARISAFDVSGVPLRFPDDQQAALSARALPAGQSHFAANPPDLARSAFFGPDDSFAQSDLAFAATLARPVPGAEMPDAANAPRDLPAIMRHIRLPVRMTFAGHERSSVVSAEITGAARADLAGSFHAEVRMEPATGHNISLHHVGARFHEEMLDWFEALPLER